MGPLNRCSRLAVLAIPILLLAGCSKRVTTASGPPMPQPAVAQAQEPSQAQEPALWNPPVFPPEPKAAKPMPTDAPDRAAEFYLMKRAGAGATDLPYEKYEAAEGRVERMRTYALSKGAFDQPFRKGERMADLGGWQPLGPGNQGGRSRHLLIHPGNPDIMYVSAVTGGVWKTTDGGQNWFPLTDMFPSLGIGGLTFEPGNPDTIYAGTGFWFNSQSGTNVFGSAPRGAGIFRSRDAGVTWERLNAPEGTHFRFINEIIVSRHDVNRIYVATWTGIFRSTDAGQSWNFVVNRSGPSQNGCQDMVARTDQDTDYLFASCGTIAAGSPAILRNTDAGGEGEWKVVAQPAGMANTTLAIAPSNQSVIYALVSSNGTDRQGWASSLAGVYRSVSNGDPETWEARVTNEDPEPLNAGLLSNNSSFFGNVCFVNGQRTISGQGWIHNAIAVDPHDHDRLFVGGIDIYRSDDGGRNWGIASFWQAADGPNGAHADVLGLVFPPDFDGGAKPRLYAITDGGVYLTDNARAEVATGPRGGCSPFSNRVSWRPLHGGYQTTQFYTGAVLPGGAAFFGGKQDNGTMRGTLAGQATWTRLFGGDGAAVAVDPRNPNTVFVSTQNFGLVRSRNGGRSFTATRRGIGEPSANFAFIAPLAMDSSNPDRLYAGARRFYRTTDQAENWDTISTELSSVQGAVSAIAVSPSDPTKVVFATSQGFLFRTDDALAANSETVWEVTRPRPGYVPAMTFDPNDANTVYAVYSQFNTAVGQNHVYRSRDGGRTWEGIDREGPNGIPDMPVLAVMVDPLDSNRIYLGTDLGVFVSIDGGESWNRDRNPFAAVPTERLILDRTAGATYLYAFTFGRGVWRTLLPGTGTPCTYSLGELTSVPAFGGEFSVPLQTADGCAWSVVPQPGALDVQNATGSGSGDVQVSVGLNTTVTPRNVGFWFQDQTVTVQQAGAIGVPAETDSVESAAEATLPYVGLRDTRNATANPSDPRASCSSLPPAKTVWWRVTAPSDGAMEAALTSQRFDAFGNAGAVIGVFAAEGSQPGREVSCGQIPRTTGIVSLSRFRFPVTAGATYLVQVSAVGTGAQDGGYTVLGLRMAP
ncbi:MAG: hypothetical protein JNL98_11405 [Bryobacterales bacterium]|nr:hypothetical protein [Bryobacterales bacterium]